MLAAEVAFRIVEEDLGDNVDEEEPEVERVAVGGPVTAVDPDEGTFTVAKGDDEVLVVVGEGAEFDGDFDALGGVAEALEEGQAVRAEAAGTLRDDGALVADEVLFVVVEEDPEPDVEEVELGGDVTAVNLEEGVFTLLKGDDEVTVVVNDATVFRGEFETLGSVAEALEAGRAVRGEALGILQDDGSVLAAEVAFGIVEEDLGDNVDEEEPEVERVAVGGPVTAVDPDEGTFTVAKGDDEVLVVVGEGAEFDGDFDALSGVAEALEGGQAVRAEAAGTLRDDGALVADEVLFVVVEEDPEPDVEEVELGGDVTAVNLEEGVFTLLKGDDEVTVVVNDATVFRGEFETLGSVAEALEAGRAVRGEALGILQDDGSVLAAEVAFGIVD